MLVELYIIFEIITLVFFVISFYTRNPLFWTITLVLASFIALSSLQVDSVVYNFNSTISAYTPSIETHRYTPLLWVNIAFAILAIAFGFYDIFFAAKQEIGADKGKQPTAAQILR